MTELRHDPLLDRTVLIAADRACRPNNFTTARWPVVSPAECPFCPGNENLTPPSVCQRPGDAGPWQVRVIPNKYPAVGPEVGGHEVIVESARHIHLSSHLSVKELANVVEVYCQRLEYWRNLARARYAIVFKNLGAQGGASLVHLHSQLVAMDHVPSRIVREHRRFARHWEKTGHCPMCQRIASERELRKRLLVDSSAFVAFCPEVSLYPFECWVMPIPHASSFETLDSDQFTGLAEVLRIVFLRVEGMLPEVGYNLVLRTAAWSHPEREKYHWRIEIMPRVTGIAGLELGTGVFVNYMPPESAAALLAGIAEDQA
jgi:UDPglucose--hexose-1-phosphate uridylyltransferase